MRCLDKVKNALLTVTPQVYHYEALKKTDKYIVWAEDGGAAILGGDNFILQQAIQGTIDYFTMSEDDPDVDRIEQALKRERISFRLNSVLYEDDGKIIHYEWIFEVA